MKATIAAFKSPNAGFVMFWEMDGQLPSGFVQITEPVVVDLPDLPAAEVFNAQVAALDAEADSIRADACKQIARVEQKKAELLALPQPNP